MEVMETRSNDDAASKMGRIMLRYRPIAPKPSSAACTARGVSVEPSQAVGLAMKREGSRRKGSSGVGKRGRKSRKAFRDPSGLVCAVPVVTLPLMPVTSERKVWSITSASPFSWPVLPAAGVVASPRKDMVSAVLVTVECVTEVWSVGFCESTSHDYELRRWLESDDCPAFVSSAEDRVTWTNASFRRMVVGEFASTESSSSSSSSHCSTSWSDPAAISEGSVEEEAGVVLATRGLVPSNSCRAFTCMTSVRYACGSGAKVSLAVPCDVWRLEDGTLAWRLDVKAALSLSTGN